VVSLAERRRDVTYLKNEYDVSERRACQAMQRNRSSYRYVVRNEFEDERYQRVVSLSQQYPHWVYPKIYDLLRGEELAISRERVRLIRRREGLQVVRKRRKRKLLGTTTQWDKYPLTVDEWRYQYNHVRPHSSLNYLTPVVFAEQAA
jgi:putative transposase